MLEKGQEYSINIKIVEVMEAIIIITSTTTIIIDMVYIPKIFFKYLNTFILFYDVKSAHSRLPKS